ncbi:hypothetical protein [Calothrix sp. NIES-2098]|uniref:hypothetical protein n=1 Tax=Calothrix sp. NIES-2098 TaxID=1954171 RepID=UPI000B5E13A6|nr:hypothetical protein NIES2098_07480 [Calothrix sp. NIES-2098]
MSLRNKPSGLMKSTAKKVARAQRECEIKRKLASYDNEKALQEKPNQPKDNYLEQRLSDVDDINDELAEWIHQLQTLLEHSLKAEDSVSFEHLRIRETFPPMELPQELLAESKKLQFCQPKSPPKWLMRLLPFLEKHYINSLKKAELNYQMAQKQYEETESSRQVSLEHLKANYEWKKHSFILDIKKRNAEIDELAAAYQDGEASAVEIYNEMVLERSEYPTLEEFQYISYTNEDKVALPQQFQVAYVPESKQLKIEYELPKAKIIPTIAEVQYDHSKDEIRGIARKPVEIEELYQDIVTAIALRTINEVFTADLAQHLDTVVFNGFVQTIDSTTGKHSQIYLISVLATKDSFTSIDFNNIDKLTCLRNLGAQISSYLTAMQPVQPIVDFNMVEAKSAPKENIHLVRESS